MKNLRWIVFLGVSFVIIVAGFSLLDVSNADTVTASPVFSNVPLSTVGFDRAIDPYDWQFPEDYGPHPNFQTEWWYYTGNLATEEGRRFGYQLTVFRRAILPMSESADSESEWRTNQLYMAHFTLTDIEAGRFFHDERFSRGGADLAGAESTPYHVWLDNWQIMAVDEDALFTQISAQMEDVHIDFMLEQVKPPALQGVNGLSAKSEDLGNASYYYTLSRLVTQGTITIGEESFQVSGTSWKDHEFSTSALGTTALGWNWFGLQFDDGRELMVGQIRQVDGAIDPYFGGLLIDEDGSTEYLDAQDFTITALDTWDSPHSEAVYPSGWDIHVQLENGDTLDFTATPQLIDQELAGGLITYWEGSVRLSGDVTGYGYTELTGYADSVTGRF